MTLRRVDLNAPAPADPQDSTPVLPEPRDVRSVAPIVLAVFGTILMLKYAEAMVIPVVLGLLISYALDPLVTGLTKLRIPRALGAALLLLFLVGIGGSLLYQLRDQVDAVVQQLPDGARRLRRVLERGSGGDSQTSTIAQVQKAATELEKAADAASAPPPTRPGVTRVQVEQPPVNISAYVMWGSLSLAAASVQALLVLFLAYFSLASGDLLNGSSSRSPARR